MKIEKKKVSRNSQLSQATKLGVASLLGMTSIYMSACVSDAESGAPMGPVEPTSSSDNSTGPEITSSSSSLDIPLSQERLSSSSQEALSSSAEKLSSSSQVAESSSSEVSESSSSEVGPTSSNQNEESSSSIQTESSSSSEKSPYGDCAPDDQKCIEDWRCEHNDPLCPQIYMCDDPKDPRCMMVSMVSTYERTDIT